MDFLRPSIRCKDLELGDLVEIVRLNGCYSHWGVYVGDGNIIHTSTRQVQTGKVVIKKEKIKDVAKGSKVMLNNMYDYREGLVPLPGEQIANNAYECLGQSYNVFTWNSVNFATSCRYGRPLSRQLFLATSTIKSGIRIVTENANEQFDSRTSIQLAGLTIGDLLEIHRDIYSYWGLYVGDGYIIHTSTLEVQTGQVVIKKERIKDVAKGSKVMLNNIYDSKEGLVPLPGEQIANNAYECLGQSYNVFTWNSVHFATSCRYGRPLSRQLFQSTSTTESGMRIVTENVNEITSIQLSGLAIGDLLELHRGIDFHWGVYVGDGQILHISSGPSSSCPSQIDLLSLCSPSGILNSKAVVKKERIRVVANGSRVMLNNTYDSINGLVPFPKKKIVQNAYKCLGNEGYNVLTNNCEHFATSCRYGMPYSSQAKQAKTGMQMVIKTAENKVVHRLMKPKYWPILMCGVVGIVVATSLLQRILQSFDGHRMEVILSEEEDG